MPPEEAPRSYQEPVRSYPRSRRKRTRVPKGAARPTTGVARSRRKRYGRTRTAHGSPAGQPAGPRLQLPGGSSRDVLLDLRPAELAARSADHHRVGGWVAGRAVRDATARQAAPGRILDPQRRRELLLRRDRGVLWL